jgi:anti-sigma28 factor (negative regulator of flagellin synthesis)
MKITNTSIETLAPTGAGAANGVPLTSRGTAAKAGTTDTVNVSSASELLSLAKASAAPERTAKVSNVAAAVRTGQYSADIASVSHAVIEGHIQ